ncbi:MAG: septal ring lytic transglycosylase RlpA family protein [Endozoicomonas sp. (ex Botrylloides leachii)]|nr:septal ring lytic transglycosylase RlpA family protein [Endozoicomonas sp. (ex Botrylloides leachii)]
MENRFSKGFCWLLGYLTIILLKGCTTSGSSTHSISDGPPENHLHVDDSLIPNAVPKPHYGRVKHTPYELMGVTYKPIKSANGYVKEGIASWYGTKFHGKKTANGEVYDMFEMTAAHKTLPLPSYVKVTNLDNNRWVVLRVNDRGPFHDDRLIDVSYIAAKKLGFADNGLSNVKVEGIDSNVLISERQGENKSEEAKEKGSRVYLQLAALEDYQNAELMRRKLFNTIGVIANVVSHKDGADAYYRVRVGPIESPKQMDKLLEALADARFDAPFVVYE